MQSQTSGARLAGRLWLAGWVGLGAGSPPGSLSAGSLHAGGLVVDGSRGLAGGFAGYIEINRCFTDALDINHGELDAADSVKRA